MKDFDRLVGSIREDSGDDRAAREAADRVRRALAASAVEPAHGNRLDSCADFRVLFADYRVGTLSEARRMLVEDHLHSCVGCRNAFQGRSVAIMPVRAKRASLVTWALAAAAVVAIGVAIAPTLDRVLTPRGPRATLASIDGEIYRVSDQGSTALRPGAAIRENEEIRTAKASSAVLRLRDGSLVEMAERSDVRLSERRGGKTVRLERGAVMVEAAKQRAGFLQISTPDCLVSVKGTIFEVRRGTKGSRVSVVQGEVKVDESGSTQLLHRGDQTVTSAVMAKTSVAEDVAWSRNSDKYLALLTEFHAIQKKIDAMPGPELRYESKIAALLPKDTIVFASVPNLGPTLDEITNTFEERARQSAVLAQWWNDTQARRLRAVVGEARAISEFLGNEIVFAIPADGPPMVLAEVKKDGLGDHLPAGAKLTVRGDIAILGGESQLTGGFQATPFWARLERSYRSGVGWIFAADMEQIARRHVVSQENMPAAMRNGLGNIGYLVVERKPNLGRTETSATLNFAGERQGISSWLAAPGPMGTLDFVSPDASFAASFVMKNPAEAVATLGVSSTYLPVLTSVASTLGGEMTVAVDGPLLPTPSWKIAIEVNDSNRFEQAMEQALRDNADVQISQHSAGGRVFYALTSPKTSYEIDYTFVDGYLLAAPNESLLTTAIQERAAQTTLARSPAFRALLPKDGHVNFSALLYYNAGVQLGPVVDQLRNSGLVNPAQQKSLAQLTANREPGLIYAYAEPDRIMVASRSGFFGLGLDTLIGLNARGGFAMDRLVPKFSYGGH